MAVTSRATSVGSGKISFRGGRGINVAVTVRFEVVVIPVPSCGAVGRIEPGEGVLPGACVRVGWSPGRVAVGVDVRRVGADEVGKGEELAPGPG